MRFIVAAVALAISAASADASVMFKFSQTGSAVPGVVASGELVLTDAAYVSGLNVSQSNPGTLNMAAAGIELIHFRVTPPVGPGLDVSGADFSTCPGCTFPIWDVHLASISQGVPTGIVGYNNTLHDFLFSLAPGPSTGVFNTDDFLSPCFRSGTCAFTGTWTLTSVPEPTSLALLGAGLIGLAAARRRVSATR